MSAVELYSNPLYNDASLVAYYRLESEADAKGGTSLTNNGTITFASAVFNNGCNMGASNTSKALSLANPPITFAQMCSAWTFTGWYKYSAPNDAVDTLAGCQTSNGTYRVVMPLNIVQATNMMRFQIYDGTSNAYDVQALTAGNWYHLAWGYDGTNMFCYVNGKIVLTQARAINQTGASSASKGFAIGAGNEGSVGSFASGMWDDFGVFTKALNSGEVYSLFNDYSFSFTNMV